MTSFESCAAFFVRLWVANETQVLVLAMSGAVRETSDPIAVINFRKFKGSANLFTTEMNSVCGITFLQKLTLSKDQFLM